MKKNFSINLIGVFGVLIAAGLIILTVLAATGSFHYRKTELVIRTGSSEKQYDGKPLKSSQWYLLSGNVLKEHTLTVETTGSQTEIGKSENVATIRVVDTSGLDVTDQYEIITELGTLEVKRRKVGFTSYSAEKIWDGAPLEEKSVQLTVGSISSNALWEAYDYAAPVQVGTYPNTFEIRITNDEGVDITENFDIEREFGDLMIRQGHLTIASGSSTKEYDGTELSNEECRIVDGKLADGHSIQYKAIGRIVDVGFSKNTVQASIVDADGKDVTKLYDISYDLGLLTIIPRKLTIRTLDVTRPYYDSPIQDDWVLISGSLLSGDELQVSTYQQYANDENEVGVHDNDVSHYVIINSNSYGYKTTNYQITFLYGKVVLTE